jgi:ABC-type branched-subunit amino acid transport system ATPase component
MLEVKNLSASYGMIPVLHDVSFKVEAGEIVTLLGSNGAGKSTILNTIQGIMKPSSGEIYFQDRSISGWAPHKVVEAGVIHIPEGHRIFPYLTVNEPSIGLAPVVVDALFESLGRLRQSGITILLPEQNALRALQLADRGYVIQHGRVVIEGNSADLMKSDMIKKAYLGR